MDITVSFNNGKWVTDPNPAIVAIGTNIRWVLRAPELQNQALTWTVTFKEPLPFGADQATLEVKTQRVNRRPESDGDQEIIRLLSLNDDVAVNHRGVTDQKTAQRPGDFKYDLRVKDAITGERIGDDDPWLIVVVGVVRPLGLYVM